MPIASKRQLELYTELRDALGRISARDLELWGRRAADRLPAIGARRVRNLGSTVAEALQPDRTVPSLGSPISRHSVLINHLATRSADAIDLSLGIYNGAARMFEEARERLMQDPRRMVPVMFALALGCRIGPGGLHCEGTKGELEGAQLDEWQRSPPTSSFVSGTVNEAAILAVADLADLIRENRPRAHDSFWDRLAAAKGELAARLAAGTSAGISYHLTVDATLEPLPCSDFGASASSNASSPNAVFDHTGEELRAPAESERRGSARGSRASSWRARRSVRPVAPNGTRSRARRGPS
jgi:hypothetical protein